MMDRVLLRCTIYNDEWWYIQYSTTTTTFYYYYFYNYFYNYYFCYYYCYYYLYYYYYIGSTLPVPLPHAWIGTTSIHRGHIWTTETIAAFVRWWRWWWYPILLVWGHSEESIDIEAIGIRFEGNSRRAPSHISDMHQWILWGVGVRLW